MVSYRRSSYPKYKDVKSYELSTIIVLGVKRKLLTHKTNKIMKAYYIHWYYPSSADDSLYYGGTDDEKLFHHKENAEKYMEEKLKDFFEVKEKTEILFNKEKNGTITKEESKELDELCNYLWYGFADSPCLGVVCERDIVFEDKI